MKLIRSAFVIDEDGRATAEPAVRWFTEGLGIATRKWDGEPVLIKPSPEGDGSITIYKGIKYLRTEQAPTPTIETSDAGSLIVTGWVPARWSADHILAQAVQSMQASGRPIEPGTYELVGPGVKGNPEGFPEPTLVNHLLVSYLHCPRDLEALTWFLAKHQIEGIVWHHGGESCKITRREVGLGWPLTRAA